MELAGCGTEILDRGNKWRRRTAKPERTLERAPETCHLVLACPCTWYKMRVPQQFGGIYARLRRQNTEPVHLRTEPRSCSTDGGYQRFELLSQAREFLTTTISKKSFYQQK